MPGSEDQKPADTPGEEPAKEGAGAAEDANGEPPVVPADGEEAKAADDKPTDKTAGDAVDQAKDLTMG